MPKIVVTINGKAKSTISVFDHGLLYGDGVYDSFRIFNGKPFFLPFHLARLWASAAGISLTIPYSKTKLEKMIMSAYKQTGLKDAFVRLLITRGVGPQGIMAKTRPSVIIIVGKREFKPLQRVGLIISKQIKRTGAGRVKSLNYAQNVLAKREAAKRGAQDALLFNEKGFLAEATTSNIFLVKNNQLYTPPLSAGVLGGSIRNAILKNFPVKEKNITLKQLLSADEVFLTGSVNFITGVKAINRKSYLHFNVGKKVFKKLMALTK